MEDLFSIQLLCGNKILLVWFVYVIILFISDGIRLYAMLLWNPARDGKLMMKPLEF